MVKEFYTTIKKEVALSIVDGEIESVRNKEIKKTGLRVYAEGYIGVAGGIGEVDLDELEKEAISNLELKIPYEEEVSSNLSRHQDQREVSFDAVAFIKDAERLLAKLGQRYPNFSLSNKISMKETFSSLKNDCELDLSYSDLTFDVSIIVREENSKNVFDTGVAYSGRHFDEKAVLEIADKVLGSYTNAVELPNVGRMPVIISKDTIESKLLQELNGESIGRGSSLFKDLVGEQKFNTAFTYGQDLGEEAYHVPFFDAEGICNEGFSYDFIKEGKIVTPYTDKKISKKYGYDLTGSSQSAYDGVPTLSVPATSIKSTGKTLEQILEGNFGVLVVIANGGDYTPEGNFGYPVQHAILTDGKQILGRLPELNISSNLYKMFGEDYKGCTEDKIIFGERSAVIEMDVSLA